MAQDWTDLENDLIVADYFAMLTAEMVGEPFNKAAHNRRLRESVRRSAPSVEFKHRNISAVMRALGERWIQGYLPADNFQMPLVDAVQRWLQANNWIARQRFVSSASPMELQEAGMMWVGPPPTSSNAPAPANLDQILRVARKYDVAGRDERNRVLGRDGERLVLNHERASLVGQGRPDLAEQVTWVSDELGDGLGYDIESFTANGRPRLIEVKTTNGWERTPFHISKNELAVADERRSVWCLFRVWNFSREPRAFELYPPLDAHVSLTATSFQATFN